MNHSNSQKFEELSRVLGEIKGKGNLSGTIFADRDGRLIFENIGNEFNGTQFSSMCASVLESAAGLGQTIGNRKIKKIITELEEKTIIIVECNDKTFLTLLVNYNSKVELILSHLQDYIQKLVSLY
ncbi:hypothetical protein LCGC14_1984680 [marine sediment metagenome]|uniref:Roadblock/LAMTOR2 domain-containing protein n=1 Tax=marine sediment metagenome TaxID=412755 RepID=A0A0F9HL36_9ZZZZ